MNFNDLIKLDKRRSEAMYVQIADSLISAIEKGILPKGYKLPGAKKMAQIAGVYTKTIEQVYEELYVQGWVIIKPYSGTYIAEFLPIQKATTLPLKNKESQKLAAFDYRKIDLPVSDPNNTKSTAIYDLILNDGHPEIRYMPALELEKNYRLVLHRKQPGKILNKENEWGSYELRNGLVRFLNSTRGLNIEVSNILISKGNQFSIFLILSLALTEKEGIAFAAINYLGVYDVCKYLNLSITFIKLDEGGIDVNDLESACKKRRIKAVYITPHLHYPTGAKLTTERRIRLLELAEKFNFLIVEDDYDFDFHYKNTPTLPVATIDLKKRVVYIGGLNRLIAASLRVSYIVGPADFLAELAKLKASIDKFSDTVLEEAIALTLKQNIVARFRNKAIKYYKQQGDFLISLLDKYLSNFCKYQKPEGGMAIWIEFNKNIPLDQLVLKCKKRGLLLPDRNKLYTYPATSNGIRIGYGSIGKSEMSKAVIIVRAVIDDIIALK